ncbi:hypothetical protein [Demequina mangrovi]|uniref:Uncharacterized protein n=1 Tax=Demequina mangrovi TaxID=1043493 RepID=A0A1H6UBI8_9MICO|nr:hypothetical protein [Demequina mangrovi]SEI88004.1 hypothetical protein SAMN05421637_0287 [Demequina mangrovi]
MSREERLRNAAVAATGDEQITHVAEFMPESALDDPIWNTHADRRVALDDDGAPETAAAGADLGADLAAHHAHLPPHVCLAVTPTRLHVLGLPHGFFAAHPEEAYLMGTFERASIEVAAKGRLIDVAVTLTDRDSGAVMELAADRWSGYHPTTVIELLRTTAAPAADAADDPSADQPQA